MSKGIYKYTDLKTNKIVYVGKDSNIDKNTRHKDHIKPSKYNEQPFNRVIQNNPNRYKYSVLYSSEYVSDDDLNMLEISFIEKYNPRFNFTKGGDGSTGFKHSGETKRKISEANKGMSRSEKSIKKQSEAISGENHHMWNKHHSEETKHKISESKKGIPLSDEHKQKISEAHNTSGYYRVYKQKDKRSKQGFYWVYRYYDENRKRNSISSVSLEKLEQKVKSKRLDWRKL